MGITDAGPRAFFVRTRHFALGVRGRIDRLRHSLISRYRNGGNLIQLLEQRVSTLEAQQAATSGAMEQMAMLERLLTRGPAARPPGAAAAVTALGIPAVAVIIPTSSRPAFVGDAITSVQSQSFAAWELMVINDGGGPENKAAVAPFLSDQRIHYLEQPRAGSAVARNRGISFSKAPLIAYLDDDNVWYPDFLACAVDVLATRADVDLVYGVLVSAHHGLSGTQILLRPFDRERLLCGNYIDTSVIVHRRELVDRFGGWDPGLATLRDWDLVLRYTQERPALPLDVLATWYREADSDRMSRVVSQEESYARIRARWIVPSRADGSQPPVGCDEH
jgi:hypothetical protein